MAMYIKDTLKASISGNAATATTLQTRRARPRSRLPAPPECPPW